MLKERDGRTEWVSRYAITYHDDLVTMGLGGIIPVLGVGVFCLCMPGYRKVFKFFSGEQAKNPWFPFTSPWCPQMGPGPVSVFPSLKMGETG